MQLAAQRASVQHLDAVLPLEARLALHHQVHKAEQHGEAEDVEEQESPEEQAQHEDDEAGVTQQPSYQSHWRREVQDGHVVVRVGHDMVVGVGQHVHRGEGGEEGGPEEEGEEEPLVVDAYTRARHVAVVVPLEHALLAQRAVVTAGWAEPLAH